MTRSGDATPRAGIDNLPVDPDVDSSEDARRRRRGAPRERSAWPRLHVDVIAVVFAGGCVGGYARYAVTQAWATSRNGFPWATFTVNVAGAFVLALVVVIAADIRPSRYVRPLLGTGFCGALTTFSSLVVAADELFAHGHGATAAAYVAATTVAALAAAWLGLAAGRGLAAVAGERG